MILENMIQPEGVTIMATPNKRPGTGQSLGNTLAPMISAFIMLLAQFGVPISAEQQNAIVTLVVTAWAFSSSAYTIWHTNHKD